MNQIVMSELTDLNDARTRGIAKRVLHEFLLAAEKAVASKAEPATYKLPTTASAPERIFLERFEALDAVTQKAATMRVMALVKAPAAKRAEFHNELGAVDLKPAAMMTAARKVAIPAALKFPAAHLQSLRLHGGLIPLDDLQPSLAGGAIAASATGALAGGLRPMQTTNKLEFRIHRVRCVDETNPEWPGDDEIAMGGTTVSAIGQAKKVAEFKVGGGFSDGKQKVYSPPKRFSSFSLTEGGNAWPKSYFVTLVLAEKDWGGGLANFLNKLLDAVKGRVVELLGAAIGSVIGSVGGPLGAVIGAAVGWVVGKLFDWIKSWWADDIFPPKTLTMSIPSTSARWAGGATDSPNAVARFNGHGGTYDVTYDWRLFA